MSVALASGALLLLAASMARATVGGPQLAEVLGWSPQEGKVFFEIEYEDEMEPPPNLYYLALDSKRPEKLIRVSSYQDTLALNRLRRRLQPLQPTVAPTIPLYVKVLARDSIYHCWLSWHRYRVEVHDLQIFGGTLDVTTIESPEVRVIRQYAIPGRGAIVAIIAFRGIPCEMGYEVQVPCLLPREHQVRIVTALER